MIIVSDTSPISYLVLIESEEVIPKLYGEVVVPEAVRRELVHSRGPEKIRERISSSPSWMKVETAGSDAGTLRLGEKQQGDLQDLDPGEREAILLAVRQEAGLLLIDECSFKQSLVQWSHLERSEAESKDLPEYHENARFGEILRSLSAPSE